MSYQVSARKYRPQTFDDIVAQEHVTKTLKNSLKNDRIGSGYLFCGPRGTGKTTIARILAKSINCADDSSPTPCGKCPSCVEIASGNSLDVLEIDAASNTGVDDVRTLRENVRYLPTSGKKRIYIIDEVHRLSGPAFDALLKTLEEPPEHVMFIFATTEPLKVPETILSRTQRYDFKRVSIDDLAGHLDKICKAEKFNASPEALRLIARKADGSVRDSLSLMDQVAAYAEKEITEAEVIEALGLVDKTLLFDLLQAVAGKQVKEALNLVKNVFDGGIDPSDFVKELLEHLRILLILTTDDNTAELLNLNDADLKDYREQAKLFSVGDIIRLMKMGSDLNRDLKDSGLDERLLLELTAVKMSEMESTVKFEEIITLLKQNPQAAGAVAGGDLFNSPEKKKINLTRPAEPQTSAANEQPVFTRKINKAIIEADWKGFIDQFHKSKPMLASQLGMADLGDVTDNVLEIVFPASGENSKSIVEKSENLSTITSSLSNYYKANLKIKFVIDKNKQYSNFARDNSEEDKAALVQEVAKSPRIKMLMEKVDGTIIGVKKRK